MFHLGWRLTILTRAGSAVLGVPGGAGFRRAPGPTQISLFLLRGTKRIRTRIKAEPPRKQSITIRNRLGLVGVLAPGKRGRELDARQAEVIMEVLQWLSQHPEHT